MHGVTQAFHGHTQPERLQPASMLLTAAIMFLVILAILVLLLGVFVQRAS